MREINMFEYESELATSDKPVLLDFYANWCSPCKKISPLMDELSQSYGDDVIIAKVDVDVQRALAGTFDVMSIPTVLLLKKGQVLERVVGAKPISRYKAIIDNTL